MEWKETKHKIRNFWHLHKLTSNYVFQKRKKKSFQDNITYYDIVNFP